MIRIPTGSGILDSALAGGIPSGSAFLAQGQEGAGATEFALTVLRSTIANGKGGRAIFVSALRSRPRVTREVLDLFDGEKEASAIEVVSLVGRDVHEGCEEVISQLGEGDVVVLESADSLVNGGGEPGLIQMWNHMANGAADKGASLVLLHAPGTLSARTEASLAESSDGVLTFVWYDGGAARRRMLQITKVRGLSPILDGEQVPLFEVALHRGTGFEISPVKSVL